MMLHPTEQQSHGKSSLNGAEENRHYLRTFIQTYRDLAVLWDTSLRDYTNREKRAVAYEQLVPLYRCLKRDATVEDVKKKINTLRTNYRKELKVVECARRTGSLHTPRCWTFQELDFLRNTEKFLAVNPNYRNESFCAFSESSQASFMEPSTSAGSYSFRSVLSSPPSVAEMFQKSFGHTQRPDDQHSSSPPQQAEHAAPSSSSSAQDRKRRRISPSPNTATTQNSDELLSMACDYLSNQFPEEESIARTWAHKLKRMPRDQRLLAEKFINDILFEGETGALHRNSVQVNAFEPYVRFEDHHPTNGDNIERMQKSCTTSLADVDTPDDAAKTTKGSERGQAAKADSAQMAPTDAGFSIYN